MPSGATGIDYWDGQMFASLRSDAFIDSLAEAMKEAKAHPETMKRKNKELQRKIGGLFHPLSVIPQVRTYLEAAWKGRKHP
jgi:erythromycin esterase-like protein